VFGSSGAPSALQQAGGVKGGDLEDLVREEWPYTQLSLIVSTHLVILLTVNIIPACEHEELLT
jgi:hypothetical protein